jgi:hypothetical protein
MVKHGKIYKVHGHHKQHLSPIMGYVRKGIADAVESITLQPEACDIRGAKRFDGQQCVIARSVSRLLHPQAVAVGRSLAYAVFDGLAIRFIMSNSSRRAVEEFDERGRIVRAPIVLGAIPASQTLAALRKKGGNGKSTGLKRRAKKVQVRAVGGGIVMKMA